MLRRFAPALIVCAASTAFAQAPAATQVRVAGVVTAASPTSLTVKGDDGASTTVTLAKTVMVLRQRPIDIETIKPGAYVATANTNIDANSGKSIELRMFDNSARGQEFSRPMAQANTTMTNGTVQTISKGAGGRELVVGFPGGSRKIIVPENVQVIGLFPATVAELKAGATVNTNAAKSPTGELVAARVTITK